METEIPSQLVIGVATYAVESLPGVENFYHDMLVDKVSYYHIIEYHIARNKSPAISLKSKHSDLDSKTCQIPIILLGTGLDKFNFQFKIDRQIYQAAEQRSTKHRA